MNRPPIRSRRGFTLVELLTVIGIIVVLVSILLPTVGKVRSQALVASTQQQIATIGGAIERYRMEHGGYPGAFPNAHFDGRQPPPVIPKKGGGSVTPTMTETMVMALCGALTVNAAGAIEYDPDLVGRGATSLGPNAARRKKYPAYIDPTPGQMVPNKPWTPNSADGETPGTPPGSGDSEVPEFMDRFPNSRPILYVRANLGGIGIATGTNPQYSTQYFDRYKRGDPTPDDPKNANDFPGDFVFRTVNPPNPLATDYKTWNLYLQNPSVANTPRRKDSYILVSAGADNAFGTKDDIFFGQ